MIISSGDGGAHTIDSQLSPSVDGMAAPQISMGSASDTAFGVDADTKVSITVSYESSTAFTKDYVSARLLEIDPDTGDIVVYPFQLGAVLPSVNNVRSGVYSAILRSDREYRLETGSSARAHSAGLETTNDVPSSLSITIVPTQDIDGTTEIASLKPANASSFGTSATLSNTALFGLDALDLTDAGTIWLDPEITNGYDYFVSGAQVASITLPGLATVNDPDGYDIFDMSGLFLSHLLAGETFTFGDPTNAFQLGALRRRWVWTRRKPERSRWV